MSNQSKQIYIVLAHTGTLASKIIRWRTGHTFSHSSISMDDNLDNMYSFARKGIYNPFQAGFVTEDIRSGVFGKKRKTNIAVFSLDVSMEQYYGISETLNEFVLLQNKLKYNYGALFYMIFFEYKKELTDRFVCSQFIASVLKINNIKLFNKESSAVSPQDFYEPLKNMGKLIYEGNILLYPKYNM